MQGLGTQESPLASATPASASHSITGTITDPGRVWVFLSAVLPVAGHLCQALAP